MSAATPFDGVNRVLDELTQRVRARCGENLVGICCKARSPLAIRPATATSMSSPRSTVITRNDIAQLQTLDLALYDELASREANGRCVVCEDKLGIGCCEVDGAIGGTPLG